MIQIIQIEWFTSVFNIKDICSLQVPDAEYQYAKYI